VNYYCEIIYPTVHLIFFNWAWTPYCKYYSPASLNNNNTTVGSEETLADNALVLADSSESAVSAPPQVGSSAESRFSAYLDHPVLINHLAWSGATTHAVLTDNLLALFLSSAPSAISVKMRNLMYFTCKIRIKVVVQGTAQAFGQMIYAFTPFQMNPTLGSEGSITHWTSDSNFVNAKFVPHLIIDPSKTATYEIELPVCTPSGLYSFSTDFSYGSYRMNRYIFNALGSGTATAASANVCTYMSLVDSSFDGLTSVTMTSNKFVAEKAPGYYSSSMHGASNVARSVGTNFPKVAPITGLFSGVADSVGNVLAYLGFSKPPDTSETLVILTRTCDSYSQIDGKSRAMVLAASQKTGQSISPAYGAGSLEDMSVDELVKKPTLILIAQSIAGSDAAEALVKTIMVNPAQCLYIGAGPVVEIGPLCAMSMCHTVWRGDLTYTFEFVASVFHRATLLIAYDPNPSATAPTMVNALATLENVTVNISGNTAVEVTVPFKQPTPVSRTTVPFVDGSVFPTNGRLFLYVINPVVSNGSTDAISYNVYLSSQNIKFMAPRIAGLTSSSVAMTSRPFVVDPATVSFGKSTDMSLIGAVCFPDVTASVKDMTSRHTRYNFDALQGFDSVQSYQVANMPFYPSTFNALTLQTFVGFWGMAYLGVRGSFSYTYDFNLQDSTPHTVAPLRDQSSLTSRAAHHLHMTTTLPILISPTEMSIPETAYAWTEPNLAVSSRVDVIAPIFIGWKFLSLRNYMGYYNDSLIFQTNSSSIVNGKNNLAMASGDDMTFCWFLGFPRMVV
jgi:hypothetical protein